MSISDDRKVSAVSAQTINIFVAVILISLCIAPGCAVKLSPDPFYLIDKPSYILEQSNIHGGLQLGKVYWQAQAWIEGVQYKYALGMHAPDNGLGHADFRIPRGAKYFQTVFGLAREDASPTSHGHAAGRIYIDNNLVWESSVSGPTAVRTPKIPIPSGAKRLRLEVDSLGTNWSDHTTWGDPHYSASK